MTHDELVEFTRNAMRDAIGDLGTGERRPYGLAINEANAAMVKGVALAAADFAAAASKPTPQSRAFTADHMARIIISRVCASDAEGSA